MERKTVHALLLSLAVVAGGVMMTTDAHAQTNTERLITTVDNTNSIMAALNSLADAVADGFAAVLAAIGMVQADTSTIMTEIGHVESELSTVHSEVEDIGSELSTVHSEVEDIGSNVASLDSSLQGISNDLAGLAGTVGGSAASFASLADTVQANSVSINDLSAKLDMISEAVGVVQETVEADPAEAVEPITELAAGSSGAEISVADFVDGISKHPANNVYTSTNSFSCDGDVFVDMVTLSGANNVLTVADLNQAADTGDPANPKTTVTVRGHTIYAAAFVPSPGANAVASNNPADLGNLFLPAGAKLDIVGSTDQSVQPVSQAVPPVGIAFADGYDGIEITPTAGTDTTTDIWLTIKQYVETEKRKDRIGTNVGNVTKAELGAVTLYNLKVDWSAPSSDTKCSIDSVSGTAVGLDKTGTVLVGLSLTDAEAALPAAVGEKTVECNLSTAEITGASIRVGGSATLNEFNTVTLSAGGETAEIKFDSANNFDEDASTNMPFRFTGSDLTVAGTSVNNLLVELEYATVEGNSCSLSE